MGDHYESFPDYVDPATFRTINPFDYDNDNFPNNNSLFDSAPCSMAQYGLITPSALHNGRGGPCVAAPGDFITPYGQQVVLPTNYQYGNPGIALLGTPMPPGPYGRAAYNLHSEPAAPSFNMATYDGGSHSFFDDSSYGLSGTPTPKPRSIPTPTPSPSSLQSSALYGLPSVPLDGLRYKNFGDAEAEASGRTPLNVDEDDFELMESNKPAHVAAIIAAFDGEFRPVPNVPLTVAETLRWVKYQTEQCDKVAKYLAKNRSAKEASAWMLLEALIDTHKFGCKKGVRISAPDMCCSARFIKIVSAIRNYAVIRFDLVRMLRFEDLAASPSHVVTRKVANWRGNAGKVKRDELNKEYAATHGVEYKAVLGNKRKYKSVKSTAKVVQEGNEDTSGMETPTLGNMSGTKRQRASDSFGDSYALSTPSKSSRTSAEPEFDNKRTKRAMVVAGPDDEN